MPLTAAQLADLQTAVADVSALVGALDADADPHPLQVQLDAANAALAAMTAERDAAAAAAAALQAKVDAVRADAQARKDADAAKVDGQNVLDILG
jgi:xylose isomerase